jgi:hypothetical protein
MVYARTAHNRTVYASPPVGGSGYGFARSLRFAPFPRKTSATFWQGCKPTVYLSALPKRHIQPERYVQLRKWCIKNNT